MGKRLTKKLFSASTCTNLFRLYKKLKMVWCLSPLDSFPGAKMYYFFNSGTYKVGRKDCDVIVQADRGISRVHAHLVVDAMNCRDSLQDVSTSFRTDVRIVDHSKYGTFVNKEQESKPVRELQNKERNLENGDLLSFGTATFRFCYVPLLFFIHGSKLIQANPSLQEVISSIGACVTHKWNAECTHVLADESSLITKDLIEAIVAKKHVLHINWVKGFLEKTISNELPSYSRFCLNLKLEGESVKVVEPKDREKCFHSHTFVLGSSHLYKFRGVFQPLLIECSGKVIPVDEFCSSSQTLPDGSSNQVVVVIPVGSTKEFNHLHLLSSLSRVNEMKLIAAALSGHLDPSIIESPSILVSSSNSTNETIVADSDVETDSATSNHVARASQSMETIICQETKEMAHEDVITPMKKEAQTVKVDNVVTIQRRHKDNESEISEHHNSDIIYSQDLIVRDLSVPIPRESTSNHSVVNFKCFRKRETISGNSFKDLIPFSRDPYKEYEREKDVTQYMKEEKRRKQMESVAEDLFNSEKVKRRGAAATSILSFFSRT